MIDDLPRVIPSPLEEQHFPNASVLLNNLEALVTMQALRFGVLVVEC